jgi:hypothetical protein
MDCASVDFQLDDLDRLKPDAMMRSANRTLRNWCGNSIIVRRLDRAPADDEKGNRRNGAACAAECENMLNHE